MTATSAAAVAQPDARGVRRVEFRALGTACLIQFRHPGDRTARQYIASALDWLTTFEAKFSRFRPDSIISRINAAAAAFDKFNKNKDRTLSKAEIADMLGL